MINLSFNEAYIKEVVLRDALLSSDGATNEGYIRITGGIKDAFIDEQELFHYLNTNLEILYEIILMLDDDCWSNLCAKKAAAKVKQMTEQALAAQVSSIDNGIVTRITNIVKTTDISKQSLITDDYSFAVSVDKYNLSEEEEVFDDNLKSEDAQEKEYDVKDYIQSNKMITTKIQLGNEIQFPSSDVDMDVDGRILLDSIVEENDQILHISDKFQENSLPVEVVDGKRKIRSKPKQMNDLYQHHQITLETVTANKRNNLQIDVCTNCRLCGKVFVSEDVLKRHFIEEHNSEPAYWCDVCDKGCIEWSSKQFHEHNVHEHGSGTVTIKPRGRPPTVDFDLRCRLCDEAFTTHKAYINHFRVTHPGTAAYKCFDCGRGANKFRLFKLHMATHAEYRPSKCDSCDAAFTSVSSLNAHIERCHNATRTRDWICDVCGRTFFERGALRSHALLHDNVRLPCSICEKTFSDRSHLNNHVRAVHLREKPHECSDCGKRFFTPSRLRQHRRTHTGDKPYSCDICNHCFARSDMVRVHKRLVHKILLKS
ncbi:uncharacterized protein LOC141901195 [Tubulanus polymorphus]|uniref:uncharacterized protein LOC141901195 n=1 Tax=Tubulanus polymorphus TaxID=672921 RepID=UPI003DA5A9DB